MKIHYAFIGRLFIPVLALVFIQGCKKSEDPIDTTTINYALSVSGGVYPNQTTYLMGTNAFPSGSVGTSNALESPSSALMYKFGKYVYQNNFGAPATLRKFEFGADGKPKELGSFAIAGLKTFGGVDFISETEAYASVAGFKAAPKLVKFNPSTMQITATIDLSSIQKEGATEVYYQGLVHRDNYLFMGVNYQKNFTNMEDKVFVVIIDRTTGTVVKQLADDRSSEMWQGGSEASFGPKCMVKDGNGDIYILGNANNGKPSGVLRIKNGETAFDPTYFFDLNAATGKPCLGLFHFGNGQTFTVRYDDPTAYPFDSDANYDPLAAAQYYKINLSTQTTSGNISADLPKLYGNRAFVSQFEADRIYFNVAAAASNSIYSYQLSNGAVKKEFDLSSGACNGFAKIN